MNIETLTNLILSKMSDVGTCQPNFFIGLVVSWFRLGSCGSSGKSFDFQLFNEWLYEQIEQGFMVVFAKQECERLCSSTISSKYTS